jgi:predicted transcriptional regulator
MNEEFESTTLVQRVVLSCLVDHSEAGETPCDTAQIRESVTNRFETSDIDGIGRISEADVMRALNGLAETTLVDEQRPDDRSPVGKGRPEYSLSIDHETLRSELSDDERVAPILK